MGHMKAIGDKLRRCNDGCSLTNFDKTVDKIFGDKPNVAIIVKKLCVILFQASKIYENSQPIAFCDIYMLKTMTNRKCRLTIGQETMAFQHMHMATPKNSLYAKELRKAYKINLIQININILKQSKFNSKVIFV